ncbi:MAG: nuclear transport factor 2 family protein [Sphingobium sp.]
MNWTPVFAAMLLTAPSGAPPLHSAGKQAAGPGEVSAAMAFLTALGRLDFDAAGGFLADDVVLDLPFAGKGLAVRGREDVLHFLRKSMAGSAGAIEYRLDHAYPSPEAGAVVLEISTQGRTAAGRGYVNRLVAVFAFRGGKIALFREYFNPAPLAASARD